MQLLRNIISSVSQQFANNASEENKQIDWFDKPEIGFQQGSVSRDNIFQNDFYKPTVEMLEAKNSWLLTQWSASVIAASENANKVAERVSQKIDYLEQEIEVLSKEKYAAESAIQLLRKEEYEQQLSQIKPYKKPLWHWLLVFGLSYSLFLGLNKHSDVELKRLKPVQYPIAALNLSAAVGITLSIKATMSSLGKRSQKFDVESGFNDLNYLGTFPWWSLLQKGNGALWLGLGFITLETCFAFPGLISILQTSLAKQAIYQVATFGASALSATVNIALAWSTGLEEAMHIHVQELEAQKLNEQLKEILDPKEDYKIATNNELYRRKIEAADRRIEELQEEIRKQEEFRDRAEEKARLEHERWGYLMKQYIEKPGQSSPHQYSQNSQIPTASNNGNKKLQVQQQN
ncbi:MAG: hypothetical protein RMX96_11670 [Nostoc sp. ChiSLP02]|nr:hypothetical protein [Nostoc sp. DedSLP05]MDZ8103521.1 hypothetical protein [Nostoc sp. DedSLP01]MDZ8185499.1 hypothetical protein [Nostoc sp. ChiSLP02]